MAPTEILAKQHLETAKKFLLGKIHLCLLTNGYSIVDNENTPKKKLRSLIKEGMPALYIGTHALLEKDVHFKKLALVIIDEQHRFGVEQRARLINAGKRVPHLLSLSATPIPRSLQLAFYGELDASRIQTKPTGRKPIMTKFVNPENRMAAYDFIRKQIQNGRQVFVITPLIEESENSQTKSAILEKENIQKLFPEFRTGLLHGKLKSREKENVMEDFLNNKIQILVSTSVVEVGVDVPNASVMLIEGAERFGLSQLHQFRGRVGRSGHQSYCFVFSEKTDVETKNRLDIFCKTLDGFKLAEADLKLRGFGEIYGQEQSGWNFKYFDPAYTSLIPLAREEAKKILGSDLNLENHSELLDKIKDKIIHFE
jgi:ATP-dependent DNA helicase RecG